MSKEGNGTEKKGFRLLWGFPTNSHDYYGTRTSTNQSIQQSINQSNNQSINQHTSESQPRCNRSVHTTAHASYCVRLSAHTHLPSSGCCSSSFFLRPRRGAAAAAAAAVVVVAAASALGGRPRRFFTGAAGAPCSITIT
jgi:hypothetical protein